MTTRMQQIWAWGRMALALVLPLGFAQAALVQESVETLNLARQAIEAQDWEKANGYALTAVKLDATSLEALRLLYQTSSRMDPAKASETASMLFLHPECSLDEKVKVLTYLQLKGDFGRFTQLYDKLSDEQRKIPDAIFLKCRFLATRGGLESARPVLEEYFRTGGSEPRFKLLYSSLLIQSGEEADRRRGQGMIVELVRGKGLDGRLAFNLLVDAPAGTIQPELFPPDIGAVTQDWKELRPQEQLIASSVKFAQAKGDASREDEVVVEAISVHAAKNLDMLCRWLAGLERFDRILEVVDEAKGRESVGLFDHRLRALAAVKGPEAAEAWLKTPHPNSSEISVWITRSKLAHQRKDQAAALDCWERAFALAQKESATEILLELYRTGFELDLPDAAVRAILEAGKKPSPSFPAAAQLQPAFAYLYEKDRLDDLLTLTWAALSRETSNLHLVNNFLYLSLILNRPGNDYVAQASKLVETLPEVAGFRATLALAYLRKGQHTEALTALERGKVDWSKESPAARAVHALVLEKNGRGEEAKTAWKELAEVPLAAGERQAFGSLLGKTI